MVTSVRPLQTVTQSEGVDKPVITDCVAFRFAADQASCLSVISHKAFKGICQNVRCKAVVGNTGIDSVRLTVKGIGDLLCTICVSADGCKGKDHGQCQNHA